MQMATVARGGAPILQLRIADGWWDRFVGLMGRRSLPADEGLLLMRSSSVHMSFMRFALDVVYLDAGFRVTKIATVRPWRFSVGGRGARHALELNAGAAQRLGLRVGEQLALDVHKGRGA